MRTADFNFLLPPELVAQTPAPKRDESRFMILRRVDGLVEHRKFGDVPNHFREGDVLVLNDSRVIRARLRGRNAKTGGEFEILLLEEVSMNDWWVMLRPGKRARLQTQISLQDRHGKITGVCATVIERNAEGHRRLQFDGTKNIGSELERFGEIPLPPYIKRTDASGDQIDSERYQTVYAKASGSVAAPTAGLHFTPQLLEGIRARGVQICHVTLHIGLGTFSPIKADNFADHVMHEECYSIGEETARAIDTAKSEGRRIIAVGTTSVRVLESATEPTTGKLRAGSSRTKIFIHPPYHFKIVDALLTNFHLPCSTLLMLVCAFAAPGETRGREMILLAYAEAIRERYRFFSYGDAMLIV
jgi:S-adenosylmethionine:tRNA ribosyltransferase-isomerase